MSVVLGLCELYMVDLKLASDSCPQRTDCFIIFMQAASFVSHSYLKEHYSLLIFSYL